MKRIIKLIDYWFTIKGFVHPVSVMSPDEIKWEQLRDDKTEFLYIQNLKSITETQYEVMEGILSGIDAFQDAAVDEWDLDETTVFKISKD